ncbi:RNA polymerase subunit sigma-70 [Taibaiella sp. KBW10]|uniref:RNA polymerase sigma factor n=1 Tax=Taibaiella sp. KBW10 TaxID=2153357 RepID=UPI000F59F3D5|nr:sigma-70 family RNA polymerase sigma factor [Taibaiella sp. KBW10]RQO32231.1 RNA polymerase subunit sigma-70 [Taibaiella sp. KBW10]
MNPVIKLSEEELISLLQHKDEKAFNYLYDNYSGAIYGLILRIVISKEYAEEVIQDVFMKVWKNIGQYDVSKGRLYTWMINISRNTAIDYLKSKSYQNEQKNQSLSNFVNEDGSQFENSHIDDIGMKRADLIGMKSIVYSLKREWQELIELAYYQGFTQIEIADKLSIPIGTVKTRTRNALLALKELLKDYQ